MHEEQADLVCKGCFALGTACLVCSKCLLEIAKGLTCPACGKDSLTGRVCFVCAKRQERVDNPPPTLTGATRPGTETEHGFWRPLIKTIVLEMHTRGLTEFRITKDGQQVKVFTKVD